MDGQHGAGKLINSFRDVAALELEKYEPVLKVSTGLLDRIKQE
jgi:hypothetical protein